MEKRRLKGTKKESLDKVDDEDESKAVTSIGPWYLLKNLLQCDDIF